MNHIRMLIGGDSAHIMMVPVTIHTYKSFRCEILCFPLFNPFEAIWFYRVLKNILPGHIAQIQRDIKSSLYQMKAR
jgi:hypothetical protein